MIRKIRNGDRDHREHTRRQQRQRPQSRRKPDECPNVRRLLSGNDRLVRRRGRGIGLAGNRRLRAESCSLYILFTGKRHAFRSRRQTDRVVTELEANVESDGIGSNVSKCFQRGREIGLLSEESCLKRPSVNDEIRIRGRFRGCIIIGTSGVG